MDMTVFKCAFECNIPQVLIPSSHCASSMFVTEAHSIHTTQKFVGGLAFSRILFNLWPFYRTAARRFRFDAGFLHHSGALMVDVMKPLSNQDFVPPFERPPAPDFGSHATGYGLYKLYAELYVKPHLYNLYNWGTTGSARYLGAYVTKRGFCTVFDECDTKIAPDLLGGSSESGKNDLHDGTIQGELRHGTLRVQ